MSSGTPFDFKGTGKEVLYKQKWAQLCELSYTDHRGRARKWECVERTTRKGDIDGVAILPLLRYAADGEGERTGTHTVIIKQYRPPVDAVCVELPAGLVDEDEDEATAALRELKEETGYIGVVESISAMCYVDCGLSAENMKLVVVGVDMTRPENLHPIAEQEDSECITSQIIPLKGLYAELTAMQAQAGVEVDARLLHLALGLDMGSL